MSRKLDDLLSALKDSPEALREMTERTPDCPDLTTFSRFVGGEMRGRERKRVLRHIVDCNRCMAAWKSVEPFGPNRTISIKHRVARGVPGGFIWSWRLWAPASALATFLVAAVMFLGRPDPGVQMHCYRYTGHIVRDSTAARIDDGATIYPGSLVWLQIKASKNGFVSLYLWGNGEGKFLLAPREVKMGQSFLFPESADGEEKKGFRFKPGNAGEYVLFLLFSAQSPGQPIDSIVNAEMSAPGMTYPKVEARLAERFKVENTLSLFVTD